MSYLIGAGLSSLIAVPAYIKQRLSLDGLFTALVVGSLVYAWGTYLSWSVMIGFFILGSLFKNKQRKREQHGRNAIQVIANSMIALIALSVFHFWDMEVGLMVALIMFIGSASDTLGSEWGTRLKGKTFDITSWQTIPNGLSGGVSIEGTIASFMGASLLAGLAVMIRYFLTPDTLAPVFYHTVWQDWMLLAGMGFLTSIMDSYLGALFQAKYTSSKNSHLSDEKEDEKSRLYAGFSWMTNDLVNFFSNVIVAIITIFFLMS